MKKLLAFLLVAITCFCFAGCNLSKVEVGAKDGVLYFSHSKRIPKMTLTDENKTQITDPAFFEKLVSCIDGKTAESDPLCDCENVYVVEIGKLDFALHSSHILVYEPLGYNIKGVKITFVECTEEEMNALFEIINATLQTKN